MNNKIMNRDQMRDTNTKLVLQQIFNNDPISRIQVSRNLNLNKATVSEICSNLTDSQLVFEQGQGESSSSGGRKPTMMHINKKYGYTATFDIGFHYLDMMLNYIDGDVLSFEKLKIAGDDLTNYVDVIKGKISQLDSQETLKGLMGVAISVHGVVNKNKVISSPFIEMGKIDIVDEIQNVTDVPVVLENEANLSAIFERDFSNDGTGSNLVTISIHKGIGAGIIIDQNLYKGENGEAGEIGKQFITYSNELTKIENICSEDAIVAEIEKKKNIDNLTVKELYQMFEAGDNDVVQVLKEASKLIAIIVHNINISFNPKQVFINSPLINNFTDVFTDIKTNLKELTNDNLVLKMSSDTKYATLLGGCSLITQEVLDLGDLNLVFKN